MNENNERSTGYRRGIYKGVEILILKESEKQYFVLVNSGEIMPKDFLAGMVHTDFTEYEGYIDKDDKELYIHDES